MPRYSLSLALLLAAPAFAADEALQGLLRLNAAGAALPGQTAVYDAAAERAHAVFAAPLPGSRAPSFLKVADKTAPAVSDSRALSTGYLGLYAESDLEITTGRSPSRAPLAGRWYFLDETIAVPKTGAPALVWLGSGRMFDDATLSEDGATLRTADGAALPLSLVPKIDSNLSYYDLSSLAFFKQRPLRVRGDFARVDDKLTFVARTIWPEDWRVDFENVKPAATADVDSLVKEADGGAQAAFSVSALWEKTPGARAWAGKPVMGLMLNGGQGDDSETQAGHFSYFAGRMGPRGEMADWLFSNFYDMDLYSEKGITAALVPMDKYMADLNSGQSWYRPSYLLVAVLSDERAAAHFQERYKTEYAKYYSHELKYDRAEKACTALIIDELRDGGWNIPKSGPANWMQTEILARVVPYVKPEPGAAESVRHFGAQEQTRLYPRMGFKAAGADLVRLADGGARPPERELTPVELMLKEDVEAVLFVRIPQLPSSRAFGSYPVASNWEYMTRSIGKEWRTTTNPVRSFPPPGSEQAEK